MYLQKCVEYKKKKKKRKKEKGRTKLFIRSEGVREATIGS